MKNTQPSSNRLANATSMMISKVQRYDSYVLIFLFYYLCKKRMACFLGKFNAYPIVFLLVIPVQSLANVRHVFPQILTEAHNQSANISSSTSLTCHVVDLGEHHVTWLKVDPLTSLPIPLAVGKQVFTTDPRYSVSFYSTSSKDSFWSLDIYGVRLEDQGTYMCRIDNRKTSVSVSITLHVVLPMFLDPNELHIQSGETIHLNCTVFILNRSMFNTSPLSLLSWYHSSDSPNRTHFHDIKIRKTFLDTILSSQLTIDRASIDHSGQWTCRFRDQHVISKIIVSQGLFMLLFQFSSID